MKTLSVDEFKQVIKTQELEKVVEEHIFKGEPYAFRDWPEGLQELRNHLSESLGVTNREEIVVVGSARVGFSLGPDSFGRRFTQQSDIDVMVVNSKLFDDVWKTILKWNYPRRFRLIKVDREWADKRMVELYWGWFRPDNIIFKGLSFPEGLKPLRDISAAWFNAFNSLAKIEGFAGRDVSGRLYRTWEHALLYHADGLRKIKEYIQEREAEG